MSKYTLVYLGILALLFMYPLVSAALSDGLVAYYALEETTGDATDTALNTHNATLSGNFSRGVPGRLDNAYRMDGVDGLLNITDADDLDFNSNMTTSFWINITNSLSAVRANEKTGVAGARSWTLFLNDTTDGNATSTDGFAWIIHEEDNDAITARGGTLESNVWQFVLVTANGTDAVIYINGVETGKFAYDGTLEVSDTTDITIGGTVLNNRINGTIDEIGFWNRSLSLDEISDLYNGGQGQSPLSPVSVMLNEPADNTAIAFGIFNATLNAQNTFNLTNATLFIWNPDSSIFNTTVNIVTGDNSNTTIFNTSLLVAANYSWNVFGCSVNITSGGICQFDPLNRSFDFGYSFNSENHTETVVELSTNDFILNVTLAETLISSDGYLSYNNTRTLASRVFSGDQSIYTVPQLAPDITIQTNISFVWELELNDGNGVVAFNESSAQGNQTVNTLSIDDCTTNTLVLVNFSIFDEESLASLVPPAPNVTIDIESLILTNDLGPAQNFSSSFNTTSASICVTAGTIDSGLVLDVLTRYTSPDYVVEYHNIQNATLSSTSFPQNISLFPLLTVDSQEFLVTFRDNSFLPVEDALITVTRKYVGDGLFRTVEAPVTDADGQTIIHLVLGDVIYTIQVSKNGRVIAIFNNIVAFCDDQSTGDCRLNLNSFETGFTPENLQEQHNLTWIYDFDRTARTISLIFSTTNGAVATVNITGSLFDARGNNTICSEQLVTAGGTLICNVPTSFGNASVQIDLRKDGTYVETSFFSFAQLLTDIWGGTGGVATVAILSLIMYLMLPLMFITGPIGIVVGAIMGLIMASLLNFYTSGSILGSASTILWLIIAGGLIIWKISQREGGI